MSLTPEGLDIRRATLGSSEISAVVGVNPYQTIHTVWSSKMGFGDFEGNEATELGNALEPAILAIYCKRYDREVRKGVYTVGPEPWMAATPDAHVVPKAGEPEEGGVEAKLVGLRSIWQWGPGNADGYESDNVPLHYLTQAFWQMAVMGWKWVDIAALLGTEFRTYRIRRNEKTQANLIAQGRRFWTNHVLTRTPPPVDGSEGAKEMLAKLYPRSGGERLRSTPELDAIAEEILLASNASEEAAFRHEDAKNKMRSAVGEAPGAFGDKWTLNYSFTKTGSRPFKFTHEMAQRKGKAA